MSTQSADARSRETQAVKTLESATELMNKWNEANPEQRHAFLRRKAVPGFRLVPVRSPLTTAGGKNGAAAEDDGVGISWHSWPMWVKVTVIIVVMVTMTTVAIMSSPKPIETTDPGVTIEDTDQDAGSIGNEIEDGDEQ